MDGEYYKENRNSSRSYTDRYRHCKLLEDLESEEVLLSTLEDKIIPVTPNDKYHRIKSHEIGRLDIIAANYYKNPLLWWVIAKANNIYNPLETDLVPIGSLLRIPSLESLYGNNGILL